MKIIVDAMGGDRAPGEIVMGALQAAAELGVEIVLVGRGEAILEAMRTGGYEKLPAGIEIAHASEIVEMEDNPATVIKVKQDSSMTVALKMLSDGVGEALVSAGNTGALLSGGTMYIKRIKGIRRAALSPFIPTKKGSAILIDCGANVECTPEYLLQFAFMGSYYAEKQMKLKEPRVGLLNIGAEENKGTALHKEAYKLLRKAKESGELNFIGNVEGRDVAFGAADVIVSDGYGGNILLKTMEGVGLFFADMLKGLFYENIFTKLAALMVKPGLRAFKKTLDYTETGGSPLLGLAKPVIKAHGSSNAKAIKNAIRQAAMFAQSNIVEMIGDNMGVIKVNAGGPEVLDIDQS